MAETRVHLRQSWIHIVAIILVAIAAADLTTGNTNKPLLPSIIGNYLTQQTDVILIAVAAFLLLFIS